ncbi:hypothetical protein CEXT_349801 [Caerostris extrusa]|uniref:Uncharacterized protein n=1 Tax=Caerostris extrusa TaxID=172846 RepID=A0AAV4U6K1_CAEEX|nr:hypothetical protein CEXT_349801 [Caerostris extrusa]
MKPCRCAYGWYSLKQYSQMCLLKLLTDEGHRWVRFFLNFSGEHSSVSISQFRWSADSGAIPTITAHLPLLNHIGHCRFWVLQIARYVP